MILLPRVLLRPAEDGDEVPAIELEWVTSISGLELEESLLEMGFEPADFSEPNLTLAE